MLITEESILSAEEVRPTLSKHMLTDGYPLVLDMKNSQGVHLVDAKTGRVFFDFFTFFASSPLGMNHPKMRSDDEFLTRLTEAALNKVSNSDVYTRHLAHCVQTFSRVGIPSYLPKLFFVSGGALAVENALKTAFDWKVRKNFKKGYPGENGHQVLHFERAFHGRTGYTMSMTNTIPMKVAYFPKFDWPRVVSPAANGRLTEEKLEAVIAREKLAVEQMKAAFIQRKDDIAAIIIEPIQGEGGDNHFRPEFLQVLRQLADENEALLIFDEVQTGVGLTGTFWAHQGLGVRPDILAFGKKTQVCGILAGDRIDEVEDNVFRVAGRINSTWGGNLVDMVRFDRILEIIEEDELVENAAAMGQVLQRRLVDLSERFDFVTSPRGRGLMCAFDLPTTETRDRVRKIAFDNGLLILGCGTSTLRFRPRLPITEDELDEGMGILTEVLSGL
ncbi:MAG TPA: L-lysine 6-transaminase [Rhodothermales bacterium]|nr:L-lysine 6-transaminase [Rhodothermales bacterium]